jgi:DNA-directed RNA polymerase sigma subunit (sigma70/sigma32)
MRRRYEAYDWGNRVLTREEERDLATRARAGDRAALEEFARCNLPWCLKLSARLAGRYGLDGDDCFGAAQLGLMDAIRRFDPAKGFKFSTYATPWIRRSVQYYVLPHRGPAFIPPHATGGEHPALAADAAAWDGWASLDAPLGDGDARTAAALVEARPDAPGPGPTCPRTARALDALDPRDREALRRKYGLDGAPATTAELAAEWGISKQGTRNRIEVARRRFRAGYERAKV